MGIWVSPWYCVYSSPHVPEAVNLHTTPREAELYMRVCARACGHPVSVCVRTGLLFTCLYLTNASVFSVCRPIVLSTLCTSANLPNNPLRKVFSLIFMSLPRLTVTIVYLMSTGCQPLPLAVWWCGAPRTPESSIGKLKSMQRIFLA